MINKASWISALAHACVCFYLHRNCGIYSNYFSYLKSNTDLWSWGGSDEHGVPADWPTGASGWWRQRLLQTPSWWPTGQQPHWAATGGSHQSTWRRNRCTQRKKWLIELKKRPKKMGQKWFVRTVFTVTCWTCKPDSTAGCRADTQLHHHTSGFVHSTQSWGLTTQSTASLKNWIKNILWSIDSIITDQWAGLWRNQEALEGTNPAWPDECELWKACQLNPSSLS